MENNSPSGPVPIRHAAGGASNEERIAAVEKAMKLAEQIPLDDEVQNLVRTTFLNATPRDPRERQAFMEMARDKFQVNIDVVEGSPRHRLLESLDGMMAAEPEMAQRTPVSWGETAGRSFTEASAPGASYGAAAETERERQTGIANIGTMGLGSQSFMPAAEYERQGAFQPTGQQANPVEVDAAGQRGRQETAAAARDNPPANFFGQLAAMLGVGKILGPAASLPGKAAVGGIVAGKGASGAASVEGRPPEEVLLSGGAAVPFGMATAGIPTGPATVFGPAIRQPAARAADVVRGAVQGGALAAGDEATQSYIQGRDPNWLLAMGLGAGGGAAPAAGRYVSDAIENPAKPVGREIAAARNVGHEPGPWGPSAPDVMTTPDRAGASSATRAEGQAPLAVSAGSDAAFAQTVDNVSARFVNDIENINDIGRKKFMAAENEAKNLVGAGSIDAAPLVNEYNEQIGRLSRSGAPEIKELRARRDALIDTINMSGYRQLGSPGVDVATSATVKTPALISLAELIEHRKELDRTSNAGKMGGRGDYPFRAVAGKAREIIIQHAPPQYKAQLESAHGRMTKMQEINDNLFGTPKSELEITGSKERAAMNRLASVGRDSGFEAAPAQGKANADVYQVADELEGLAREIQQEDPSFKLTSGGRKGIQEIRGQRAIDELSFGQPSITAGSSVNATLRSGLESYWMPTQARVINPVATQVENTAPLPLLFGVGSTAETEEAKRRRLEEIQRLEASFPMAGDR